MTQTAVRLRRLGLPHARARAGAVLLTSAGAAFAIAAAGLLLAPRIFAVLGAWLAIAAVAGAAVLAVRRVRRAGEAAALAPLVERVAGSRPGSVAGVVARAGGNGAAGRGTSAALFALADERAAQAVDRAAPAVHRLLGRETRRELLVALPVVLGGAALFVAASPAPGRAAFWHPLRAVAAARAPVRLSVDRATVRRGDTITVAIDVPAATQATLWTRRPGEPWRPAPVVLDSAGHAVRRLGPLETDVYLRAASGGRSSPVRKVSVTLPAFLSVLQLTARFPGYLRRDDQELVPGPDTIPVPAGTVVFTSGMASVALGRAVWSGARGVAPLGVSGTRFEGRFAPRGSGAWRLELAALDDSPFEGVVPELSLRVVPDSAPIVRVAVPERDTTLPLSLRQPLVIDARDDYGLARLAVLSWRVSQTGKVGEAVGQSLDLGGVGDRAIVQGELNAEGRGLLPGDTLRFLVEAWDNAPVPHRGRSAEVALRLLTREELRAAARAAAAAAAGAADSLAAAGRDLSTRTGDLAAERARDATPPTGGRPSPAGPQAGTLPFQATERAEAIARGQAALQQRVRELSRSVEEIARAVRAAGLDDTAFQARLRELQALLQRALTPELEQRLRELERALERLDPEATRQALQRLAEAQQQLREVLAQSQELFRRAAVEGALSSLAADAEDLQRRQAEWNRNEAPRADTGAAARQRVLADRTDSLAGGLTQVTQDLARSSVQRGAAPALVQSLGAARRAEAAMRGAAEAADQNDAADAGRSGAKAAAALDGLPETLRGARDSLAREWREETLAALGRALSETATLAERQERVADALRRGEGGAATRSRQASVEEGTEAVERQIREAAGKHALVSPQLEAALGFAQRQMGAAREQLEQAQPNAQTAAALAEEAVDALNATALALARSKSQVAGAQSGTGFAEAVEQLARLAQQQQGLNALAQGLLPMLGPGSTAVLGQLRALAARQRALAEQLERLQAEGGSAAAGPLAEEARELARQLEAGQLDRQTVERQQRLYRRLLDAGRTLSGPEPDEQRERVSRPAQGDSIHIPGRLAPGATGRGPMLRYPTWQELADLTPEQRRLVLEYFRRLNAPASAPVPQR